MLYLVGSDYQKASGKLSRCSWLLTEEHHSLFSFASCVERHSPNFVAAEVLELVTVVDVTDHRASLSPISLEGVQEVVVVLNFALP